MLGWGQGLIGARSGPGDGGRQSLYVPIVPVPHITSHITLAFNLFICISHRTTLGPGGGWFRAGVIYSSGGPVLRGTLVGVGGPSGCVGPVVLWWSRVCIYKFFIIVIHLNAFLGLFGPLLA